MKYAKMKFEVLCAKSKNNIILFYAAGFAINCWLLWTILDRNHSSLLGAWFFASAVGSAQAAALEEKWEQKIF